MNTADTASEREVQKALDALMGSRTTIAIAHRLSTMSGRRRPVEIRTFGRPEVFGRIVLMPSGS